MPKIKFKASLVNINSWTVLRLPKEASAKLPARSMTLVKGTFNGVPFKTVLDPDGKGSHWFPLDADLQKKAKVAVGDMVTVEVEPSKDWPEPEVPADVQKALAAHRQANDLWAQITPMARWDWLRWIGSTKQPETRARRIEAACDKLKKGERRPCCFNRSMCLIPEVSKNGVLLEPGS